MVDDSFENILETMITQKKEEVFVAINNLKISSPPSKFYGLMLSEVCWRFDFPDLIKFLIVKGADINYRGFEGRTPLIDSCSRNFMGNINVLLEFGADPNAETDNQETPLSFACTWGYTAACRQLLLYGGDALKIDKFGNSPKSIAAANGYNEMVNLINNKMLL